MTNWNEGYVSDLNYTYGYYRELNPLHLKFALTLAGIKTPTIKNVCELGFGQGLSLNFISATLDAGVYGTDFNPSQAAFSSELNIDSGLDANIYDESFEVFCNRGDLPKFDIISLHGIWSWISEKNRSIIVDFIRDNLSPGGVVYLGYNTLPGWSHMLAIRDYMLHISNSTEANRSNIAESIKQSLNEVNKLIDAEPLILKSAPALKSQLEGLNSQAPEYLAHEYFNRDWMPMSFAEMSSRLTDAKLTFATSADALDQISSANFTEAQHSFLSQITDLTHREMSKDLMINQVFRKDYWVKGARRLNNTERLNLLASQKICLITDGEFEYAIIRHGRKITLERSIYEPVLEKLSDYKPYTIAEISDCIPADADQKFNMALEVICVLLGCAFVSPAHENVNQASIEKVKNLNRNLIQKIKPDANMKHLCSPIAATGIPMDWLGQLFVLSILNGGDQIEDLVSAALDRMNLEGRRMQKNGSIIENDAENISELRAKAKAFLEKKTPILRAHKIF